MGRRFKSPKKPRQNTLTSFDRRNYLIYKKSAMFRWDDSWTKDKKVLIRQMLWPYAPFSTASLSLFLLVGYFHSRTEFFGQQLFSGNSFRYSKWLSMQPRGSSQRLCNWRRLSTHRGRSLVSYREGEPKIPRCLPRPAICQLGYELVCKMHEWHPGPM